MIWTILTIILTGIVLSLVFRPLRIKYAVLWKQFLKSGYFWRLTVYKTLHPTRWYDVFALTVEIICILIDFTGLIIIGPWYNMIKLAVDSIKRRKKEKNDEKSISG